MKRKILFLVVLSILISLFLSTEGKSETSKSTGDLPKMMFWSIYDVGSAAYTNSAAVADALMKKYGTKIRIIPSGTAAGRMIPMRDGMSTIGYLGDEYTFSFEGLYEFADYTWGPQDMRLAWAPWHQIGLAVLASSDIKTPKDLKGKKFPFLIGNPSMNVKYEAALAYGGLTWKDVQKIEWPTYGTQGAGLQDGKLDCIGYVPSASAMYEVDSAKGIRWLELPPSDKEEWARFNKVCPWVSPVPLDIGPALKKGEPKYLIGFVYPLCAYAMVNPDVVYQLVKGIHETFEMYKSASPILFEWDLKRVAKVPTTVPFHEGTVRFLEEKGLWTSEADKKNKELVERFKKLRKAWETVIEEASSKKISSKDFPTYWLSRKKEIMGD